MGATETVWPWLLATLLFLILVGSGRTLRGGWLARPPFGGGVALSAALGVLLFSMIWMGLGHFALLRAPWPWLLFGLGGLLALPGLFLTWRDHRQPGRGLERGFGPRWLSGPAWLLLVAALVLSMVWITGAFGWEGRAFLFERAGFDWAVGASFFDSGIPRDPFLGSEPLALWVYGLGSPAAGLALSWWLGVAILFGICGLGWRLHAHGAGLVAATLMAIVLFATDRPLFLAPALPATLALLAVMILAVESRGRPHLGRTLVAGALGGFALISDLGAGAMLVALVLFGPSWCKKGEGFGRYGDDDESGYGDDEGYDEDYEDDHGDEDKLEGAKKWLTPTRHLGYGLIGLSLPLLPWAARSYDWVDDPWYGLRGLHFESDDRFRDYEPGEPGFQPSFRRLEDLGAVHRGRDEEPRGWNLRLQVDPIFLDYQPRIGSDEGRDYRTPIVDGYLDATEWGLGIGLLGLLSPLYGRRRRERLLYVAPGVLGYGLGAWLGGGETTHPSALALLSVSAGSTLYTWRGCAPRGRNLVLGGTALAGAFSLGLSGASECGYWDEFDDFAYYPQLELRYQDDQPARDEPAVRHEDGFDRTPRLRYRWHDPTSRLEHHDQYQEETPSKDAPDAWGLSPGIGYDYGEGLKLEYRYRDEDRESPGGEGVPAVPHAQPPAEKETEDRPALPRQHPSPPTQRPNLQRNY